MAHTNGTYHVEGAVARTLRQAHLLIGLGAVLAGLGVVNVVRVNAEMSRMERSGPERLALAGDGVERFVPGLLANLPRARAPLSTATGVLADDPRRTPAYISAKQNLERWVAVTGLGLSILFVGLERRVPTTSAGPRSPTGTDLARLLILVSLAYAGLSIFEG